VSTIIRATIVCRSIEQVGSVVALAQSIGAELDMETVVTGGRRRAAGDKENRRKMGEIPVELTEERPKSESQARAYGVLKKAMRGPMPRAQVGRMLAEKLGQKPNQAAILVTHMIRSGALRVVGEAAKQRGTA